MQRGPSGDTSKYKNKEIFSDKTFNFFVVQSVFSLWIVLNFPVDGFLIFLVSFSCNSIVRSIFPLTGSLFIRKTTEILPQIKPLVLQIIDVQWEPSDMQDDEYCPRLSFLPSLVYFPRYNQYYQLNWVLHFETLTLNCTSAHVNFVMLRPKKNLNQLFSSP